LQSPDSISHDRTTSNVAAPGQRAVERSAAPDAVRGMPDRSLNSTARHLLPFRHLAKTSVPKRQKRAMVRYLGRDGIMSKGVTEAEV
jgi:hypothetical protein